MLLFFSFLLLLANSKGAEEITVSYCKDTAVGEWRNIAREMFSMTKVGIAELFCNDVSPNDIVLATFISGKYEQHVKPVDEDIHVYLGNILRMVSSSVIATVSTTNELQEHLKNDQDTFVAYIEGKDSTDYQIFQQAALSVEVPNTLQIIATHSPSVLNKDIKKKMQVWYVKHDKWIELNIPAVGDDVTPEEARTKLITYVRHLKYPTIFTYTGDDYTGAYEGSMLDYVLVLHSTDKKVEVTETIVEPLSKELQLLFAFILIDCEKFPGMMDRYKVGNKSLPLLISLKNGQTSGVHIDGKEVSYTDINNLLEVLMMIKEDNPKILTVDAAYLNDTNVTNSSQKEDHRHTEL